MLSSLSLQIDVGLLTCIVYEEGIPETKRFFFHCFFSFLSTQMDCLRMRRVEGSGGWGVGRGKESVHVHARACLCMRVRVHVAACVSKLFVWCVGFLVVVFLFVCVRARIYICVCVCQCVCGRARIPGNVCVVCLLFLSCSVTSGYRIFDRDDFFGIFFTVSSNICYKVMIILLPVTCYVCNRQLKVCP